MKADRKTVAIAYKSLPAYRTPFYESLRAELATRDIDLKVFYGNPFGAERLKNDSVDLPWAFYQPNRFLRIGSRYLVWQPIWRLLRRADLVIVEQASKLLINYPLLLFQLMRCGPPVALWGHGTNLQKHNASWLGEHLKARYSRLPHWWFAYTRGTADRVAALGFPFDRITVVQNSIDTRTLKDNIDAISDVEEGRFRESTKSVSGMTGLYIGSLYSEKRIDFLLEVAQKIAQVCPQFVLLIAGDGPDRWLVEKYARDHPFVHFLGRVDGATRALALRTADVLLMPGLVGLAIVDSFVGEAPLITTDIDFHSPEIEYLSTGVNGICVSPWHDKDQFANVVADLLRDTERLELLREGCRHSAKVFSHEEMVLRFADGIEDAVRGSN